MVYAGDVSQPTGGTDRVTALASGMAKEGLEITLVIPTPSDGLPNSLDSVPVQTVNPTSNTAIGRAVSVAREATSIADSDTHLQFEHSLLAGIGCLLGGSNVVLDMHDLAYARYDHVETSYASLAKRGISKVERYAISQAEHVITVSAYMRNFLVDRWNVNPERVSVIPNGYFPESIVDAKGTAIVEGRVCFLGTLHPKVDIGVICEIADLPAVSEMIVIGDGAHREQLEYLSNTYDKLKVMGRLPDDDAFELVASAEVVVNPQQPSELQRSSSPVKLFYYAALGKPIVSTRGPTVVEQLIENDAARAPSSGEAFIATVTEILDNPKLAGELGQNAECVAKSFSWTERAESISQLYQELTSNS